MTRRLIVNVLATVAFVAVLWGLWMAWPPLAPIVGGGFVLALLIAARRQGSAEGDHET